MPEGTGPLVVTIAIPAVGPSCSVTEDMIVPAPGSEFGDGGSAALCPRRDVVQVAPGGWNPATGKHTGWIQRLNQSSLCGGGTTSRQSDVQGATLGIGQQEAPLVMLRRLRDLARDVGNDRPVAAEIAGEVGQSGQGGEIDGHHERPPTRLGTLPCFRIEKVEGNIGSQLIHRPRLGLRSQPASRRIDPIANTGGTIRWKVQQEEMGGTVDSGLEYDPAFLRRGLVTVFGILGIGLDAQFSQQRRQLSGGEFRGSLQRPASHFPCLGGRKMIGAMKDEIGSPPVEAARDELPPDGREASLEIPGDGQFIVGGPPGEPKSGPNLGGARIFHKLKVILAVLVQFLGNGVGNRRDRGIHLGLVVGRHPLMGSHDGHPIVT